MSLYQLPSQRAPQFYFDNNATTPICAEVVSELPELIKIWGNPSSIHWGGRAPKNILRDARKMIAESIGASVLELIFTSGGTESNNTIIRGVFDYWHAKAKEESLTEDSVRDHYMCSAVEHPAVMKTMLHLSELGAKVDIIPVGRDGKLDLDFLKSHLSKKTALVSVMAANNETGTLFPISEIADLVHSFGALFHSDCVQAFGKIPVRVYDLKVDYASFSAHKVNALKGTGVSFVKKGAPYLPMILGGGQERHRRGGTENVLGIAALGIAVHRFKDVSSKAEQMAAIRDHFELRVLKEIGDVSVTAGESPRLPNTSSLVLKGCDGETLLMGLDIKGYAVSTGAACSSGNPEPSPVLLNMGLTRAEAQNSLRVSIGWGTTLEEVDTFVDVLKSVVERLRNIGTEVQNV